MSNAQFLALLVTPLGALLIGAWAYWVATRDSERHRQQGPGE